MGDYTAGFVFLCIFILILTSLLLNNLLLIQATCFSVLSIGKFILYKNEVEFCVIKFGG